MENKVFESLLFTNCAQKSIVGIMPRIQHENIIKVNGVLDLQFA